MSQPTWKALLDQIKADTAKTRSLDRFRDRFPASSFQEMAGEILREMASALNRADSKVSGAISELTAQGEALDALTEAGSADQAEIRARVDAFNRQREVAEKALWELRVHREALGFRLNDDLPKHYPIPPKRVAPV